MNLAPFVPGVDGDFDEAAAAHLLRRAGFGAAPRERARAVAEGLDATLARLFASDEGRDARAFADASRSAAAQATAAEPGPLQGLWLARMVRTAVPLRERLALFWHDHFATSIEKVARGAFMWRQYELLRERGGGPFRELVQAVARDPAMLVWLDGSSNEKTRPNENFARELLELFTLGIGSYDERDVQEAARAFAGWHLKDDAFELNERARDRGAKRVLGRELIDGDEVIDAALAHAACPRFLARKLLRAFVSDTPEAAAVEELAGVLVEEHLVIEPAVRRLLASRRFFAAAARRARIAAPVEWCVALLRRTGARASFQQVAAAAGRMGQALFAPPSVAGWKGGTGWISTQALLQRGRFAAALAYGGELGIALDWGALAGDACDAAGERLVAALESLLLDDGLEPATRERLAAFADSAAAGRGVLRVQRTVHQLLGAPEALLV